MKQSIRNLLFLATIALSNLALAQSYYKVQHLDTKINTTGSETGGAIIDDSIFLYTSMMEESPNYNYLVDLNPTLTQVFQSTIGADGSFSKGEINHWGLNIKSRNSANVAYDAKRDVIYFTRMESGHKAKQQIFYSMRKNHQWTKPQPMEGDINLKGYTSTHPTIGHLPNGETILYYSSDRPGGLGGMDIWYAILISPSRPGNSTNLGAPVNTDSNEISPFYSFEEEALYFSSNRPGGLGGYDIYNSKGARNTWQQPENMGQELNSEYNDLFFTTNPCQCQCFPDKENTDPIEACGFLTSNRKGAYFNQDSNCCNDIYLWTRYHKVQNQDSLPIRLVNPDSVYTAKDLLPLALYFHNDEPDPKTLSSYTNADYSTTWRQYMKMKEIYKGAQPNPIEQRKRDSVQKAVDYFFDHELKEGHDNLLWLLFLIHEDLKMGYSVEITVNGYASPLFEDEYNQRLSERRISCLRNEMINWNDHALRPYLSNGRLWIRMIPKGSSDMDNANTPSALKDPNNIRATYSMEAAHARRIEITDYKTKLIIQQ